MQVKLGGKIHHLSYCTNIHPGESWGEIFSQIKEYLPKVRENVQWKGSFGIGLRLSQRAVKALLQDERKLEELQQWLKKGDYYIYTLNGFPYGEFHQGEIKEEVYQPDWSSQERLEYTKNLLCFLEKMLPEGVRGSISTVPIGFKNLIYEPEKMDSVMENLKEILCTLDQSKKKLSLAFEPEPECFLEMTDQAIQFFQEYLYGESFLKDLSRKLKITGLEVREKIQKHFGVCFDVCHSVVEFEDVVASLKKIKKNHITIQKIQLSSCLKFFGDREKALEVLKPFQSSPYLHQIVVREASGKLTKFLDINHLLKESDLDIQGEWRVHIHTPLFQRELSSGEGTQEQVMEVLTFLKEESLCDHLEVETYTFDILPHEMRESSVDISLGKELKWCLKQFQ